MEHFLQSRNARKYKQKTSDFQSVKDFVDRFYFLLRMIKFVIFIYFVFTGTQIKLLKSKIMFKFQF